MALVWDGKTFTNQAQFAAWLAARGGSYATWAGKHPDASAQLEGRGTVKDFTDQLQDEGIYKTQQAAAAGGSVADAAVRREALRKLAVQFGGDLGGIQDPYGDLDPATRDIAAHNPFSTIAQLQRDARLGRGSIRASLSARGVRGPNDRVTGLSPGGEYDAQMGGLANRTGLADYGATNDINDRIEQAVGAFNTGEQTRLAAIPGQLDDAQKRLMDAGIRPAGGAASGSPAGGGFATPEGGFALPGQANPPMGLSGQVDPSQIPAVNPNVTPGYTGDPAKDPAYLRTKAHFDAQNTNLGIIANRQNNTKPGGGTYFKPWQYATPGYMGGSGASAVKDPFKQKLVKVPAL